MMMLAAARSAGWPETMIVLLFASMPTVTRGMERPAPGTKRTRVVDSSVATWLACAFLQLKGAGVARLGLTWSSFSMIPWMIFNSSTIPETISRFESASAKISGSGEVISGRFLISC